jgi:DHA1 family tetracycline resistance protein-like MFS transporter
VTRSGSGGHGRAAFVFIFITVLLDMLALSVILPVLPELVVALSGGQTARGATIYGLFGTTFAAMQFVFAPVLGSLSDRFGRRRVILLSNAGLGLDYVLMALAPSLWWLFAGRIVSGITSSSVPTAMAYIADVTEPKDRAAKFGMLGVAFGVGFIVGPSVGGLLGGVSVRAPFWASAALSLANAAYGFFILPESLPLERRSPFHWKRASVLGSFRMLRSRPPLLALGAASFLSMLGHDSLPTTFVLYVQYRYHWTERTIGLVLGAVGAASLVVQGVLVGRMVEWLGERQALAIGLLCGAAGMAVYALAPTGTAFVCGLLFTAIYGLATPSLQSLMTSRVAATEQGQLQGAIGSMNGVANMIAPVLFTGIFAEAVGRFRPWNLVGAPFMLASALLVGAFFVGWRVTARVETTVVSCTS